MYSYPAAYVRAHNGGERKGGRKGERKGERTSNKKNPLCLDTTRSRKQIEIFPIFHPKRLGIFQVKPISCVSVCVYIYIFTYIHTHTLIKEHLRSWSVPLDPDKERKKWARLFTSDVVVTSQLSCQALERQ